jgi:hypothetical protein
MTRVGWQRHKKNSLKTHRHELCWVENYKATLYIISIVFVLGKTTV